MKNKFPDLNDHLFAQIERLADETKTPEEIELEEKRGYAIVAVSEQILRGVSLQLQAAKIVSDHGIDPTRYLPKLGNRSGQDGEGGQGGAAPAMIEARKP